MSVIIKSVDTGSPADIFGLKPLDVLLKINKNEIVDVLDYRFFQFEKKLKIEFLRDGKIKKVKIKKQEFQELGLQFETYLMDKQKSCKNKCIFCFIDQLPKGLRKSLYFKDDDSRLSFLFGNYITLTNLTDHEIERIVKMHISPVNVSVHTTNPELRVKMMKNQKAGETLKHLKTFSNAGIRLNCQLVLCPGFNDGEELKRSISDLLKLETVDCIAAVPVGLTDYRDGLEKLTPFNKETAGEVIDIIESFQEECLKKYGERKVYPSDEFFLTAEREIPCEDYYGDFLQLENGVGMWALLKSEALSAIDEIKDKEITRNISVATGILAAPLINIIVDFLAKKCNNFKCKVYPIKNDFFGNKITVSGLVTATDIIKQLKGKELGDYLILPSSMLNTDGVFLDDLTKEDIEKELGVKVKFSENDGYRLVDTLLGKDE